MRLALPTPRALFFGLLYVLAPVAFLALMYVLDRPYQLPDQYAVWPTAYNVSLSDTPPEEGWQPAAGEWPRGRIDGEPFTSVWYRYPVGAAPADHAFYVPAPYANFDVWRGGEPVFRTADNEPPLWFQRFPFVVDLSDTQGDADGDLLVRLTRQASSAAVNYAFLAPRELVQRDLSETVQIYRTVPMLMLVVMATFGAAVALIFLFRPSQTAYGWYALTVLLWGLHTAWALYQDVPINHFVWSALNYATLAWLTTELYFVNRYFEVPAPRLERGVAIVSVLVIAGVIAVAVPALGSRTFEAAYVSATYVIIGWFFTVALIVTSRYFVAVRRRWDFETISLWLSSGVVIGVGIRDILYEKAQNLPLPGTVYYLQYAVLLPIVLFGIQLIRRFVNDSRTAELRAEELNAMVEARSAELASVYRKLNKEERDRILAEERTRLMRDMHDGLGGQLVHALALSERAGDEDLRQSLRLALDDLRLIVDSISPSDNSLQDLLASYRYRVSKMLERSDFAVRWQIDHDIETPPLRPNASLSILRIVQEAVTNAVRHSGGDALTITLTENVDGLVISVRDNGDGIADGVHERGLNNMRVRANEVGGELDIDTGPVGTEIRLTLPPSAIEDVTLAP